MDDIVRQALNANLGPVDSTIIDITNEVVSARSKFVSTDGLMTALTEEVGELAKAILDEPWANVYTEAKQVAAMAIRMMEECDPTLHIVRINRGCDVCCEDMARLMKPSGFVHD